LDEGRCDMLVATAYRPLSRSDELTRLLALHVKRLPLRFIRSIAHARAGTQL